MTTLTYDPNKFECVTSLKALKSWVKKCEKAKSVCYDTETTGLDYFTVDLVGHALAVENDGQIDACYIPTGHKTATYQLSNVVVLEHLRHILEDETKPKILSNAQYDMLVLNQSRYATQIRNVHDTVYMAYVLHGDTVFSHGMDLMASVHLGIKTIKFDDVVKPALGIETFAQVDLKMATDYSAEDGAVTLMLAKVLQAKLKAEGLWEVYNDVDRPLLPALFDMKKTGIRIDAEKCYELAKVWTTECDVLKARAYEIAGKKFSLNSPKQLAAVLYDERKLSVPGYTDSGAPATNKDALEELEGDELVDVLQSYRKIDKLRSTYAVALPTKVRSSTGRVHTDLKPTRTSTGRLASADPNLQNIPTRSEEGKLLREVFLPGDGLTLFACDFSQIEYRILAHLCHDDYLLNAFRSGKDLHATMAADVRGGHWTDYNNKKDKERYAVRTAFKNVNFAVIYGAGPKKIARMSKIELAEAYTILAHHEELAPKVYEWKEGIVFDAYDKLYAETMFGRRIHVPGIRSKKTDVRGHAERLSVNGTVQGSAADLMRLAMAKVRLRFIKDKTDGNLLLQVHDELVVECRMSGAEQIAKSVQYEMEHAADSFVEWQVPIIAEYGIGKNWREAK